MELKMNETKYTNRNDVKLPSGKLCGGRCGDCYYGEWDSDRGQIWCTYQNTWRDKNDTGYSCFK